jgi:hypothetical protein
VRMRSVLVFMGVPPMYGGHHIGRSDGAECSTATARLACPLFAP